MIRSLRPNVSEAEAWAALRAGLPARLGLWGAPLRSLAAAYVPFRLYHVEIVNGPRRQRAHFAVDAVSGALDLYRFDAPPAELELVEVQTRNRLEPRLDEAQARRALEEKLRRTVFQAGFFRVRDLSFHAEHVALDLHLPYWLGFYGGDDVRRLRVLDAVRRRFEGAKARALFEDWLRAADHSRD